MSGCQNGPELRQARVPNTSRAATRWQWAPSGVRRGQSWWRFIKVWPNGQTCLDRAATVR